MSDLKSEFLVAMAGRSQSKTWANDSSEAVAVPAKKPSKTSKAKFETVNNKKPGGQGLTLTRMHVTFDQDDEEEMERDGDTPTHNDSIAVVPELALDENVSNLEYLKSKMKNDTPDQVKVRNSSARSILIYPLLADCIATRTIRRKENNRRANTEGE